MAQDMTKIRGMSPAELTKEEGELREEIWKLRLQQATGQLQDPGKIRRRRHDLARLLTIRQELALASASAEGR